MPRPFHVEVLKDEFGQYELEIVCVPCGHIRRTTPNVIAKFVGWDARLDLLSNRLRCSKCGAKACKVRAIEITVPRGYKSH